MICTKMSIVRTKEQGLPNLNRLTGVLSNSLRPYRVVRSFISGVSICLFIIATTLCNYNLFRHRKLVATEIFSAPDFYCIKTQADELSPHSRACLNYKSFRSGCICNGRRPIPWVSEVCIGQLVYKLRILRYVGRYRIHIQTNHWPTLLNLGSCVCLSFAPESMGR